MIVDIIIILNNSYDKHIIDGGELVRKRVSVKRYSIELFYVKFFIVCNLKGRYEFEYEYYIEDK